MKKKIDLMSVFGMLLALALLGLSIVLVKNSDGYTLSVKNLAGFFNGSSLLIVIGGVAAALMLSFPWETIKRIPRHMHIIFAPRVYIPETYVETLTDCARKARMNGLLAIEEDAALISDVFIKNSLQMVVDSIDPDKVRTEMEAWIESIDERHFQERAFYEKGAALSPAFGLIGTLIGLINMLRSLDSAAALGPNLAFALLTALYGVLIANLFFLPVASKLRVRHDEEYLCMRIISEGIQAIQAGENPKMIREKLSKLLPNYKQKINDPSSGSPLQKDFKPHRAAPEKPSGKPAASERPKTHGFVSKDKPAFSAGQGAAIGHR